MIPKCAKIRLKTIRRPRYQPDRSVPEFPDRGMAARVTVAVTRWVRAGIQIAKIRLKTIRRPRYQPDRSVPEFPDRAGDA